MSSLFASSTVLRPVGDLSQFALAGDAYPVGYGGSYCEIQACALLAVFWWLCWFSSCDLWQAFTHAGCVCPLLLGKDQMVKSAGPTAVWAYW